jgi:hypothetical protein
VTRLRSESDSAAALRISSRSSPRAVTRASSATSAGATPHAHHGGPRGALVVVAHGHGHLGGGIRVGHLEDLFERRGAHRRSLRQHLGGEPRTVLSGES